MVEERYHLPPVFRNMITEKFPDNIDEDADTGMFVVDGSKFFLIQCMRKMTGRGDDMEESFKFHISIRIYGYWRNEILDHMQDGQVFHLKLRNGCDYPISQTGFVRDSEKQLTAVRFEIPADLKSKEVVDRLTDIVKESSLASVLDQCKNIFRTTIPENILSEGDDFIKVGDGTTKKKNIVVQAYGENEYQISVHYNGYKGKEQEIVRYCDYHHKALPAFTITTPYLYRDSEVLTFRSQYFHRNRRNTVLNITFIERYGSRITALLEWLVWIMFRRYRQ